MRLLHYLEIQNFKHFGERQRIELDHPAVLIGPNNCGKTTAIQAIALWSQAVKTWYGAKGQSRPKERTATSLNRLNIVSVPVQRTRYFWHNTAVRTGNREIPLVITAGVQHENVVEPVTMRFRNQGEDLVYCTPDETTLQNPEAIRTAAGLDVHLLYPMSGLETEEPILQPGRIDVLLGQGQTAQVLRNLCLLVFQKSRDDWQQIVRLMNRLFSVELGDPTETARGSIDLFYGQPSVRAPLEVSVAGRGLQQVLLIFAYLYSHRNAVLLIDEPDAHLEILRQRQVYVLLREIAAENDSQVVLVTHSEVVMDEALDRNLTLLLGQEADDLAAKPEIRNALTYFGADHYIRAVLHRYVLYVEGTTDLDILREFASRLSHPASTRWDDRINAFYVNNSHPQPDLDAELERVEGGYGLASKEHFHALRGMVAGLRGLAIRDSDGRPRQDTDEGGLRTVYWQRYEAENYFITPELLLAHVAEHYGAGPLFSHEASEVLDALIRERVFDDRAFPTWKRADAETAQVLWDSRTANLKLSDFAEEFFRRLGERLGNPMLLRKGDLHRLIRSADPTSIPHEVGEKLDLLTELLDRSTR
ncbi:MAG: AAA family ATPase [Spirochaetaceae bacterium]|nr:AAA family ATPase [Spirochaetaceae bacterium]